MFNRDLFSLNDSFETNIALNSRKKLRLHEKFFFSYNPQARNSLCNNH